MSLDALTLEWLEKRSVDNGDDEIYCRYCSKRPSILTGGLCAGTCPLFPAPWLFVDAAEFEARVAAKLTDKAFPVRRCDSCLRSNLFRPNVNYTDCGRVSAECRLMYARLDVEAEMEKEEA